MNPWRIWIHDLAEGISVEQIHQASKSMVAVFGRLPLPVDLLDYVVEFFEVLKRPYSSQEPARHSVACSSSIARSSAETRATMGFPLSRDDEPLSAVYDRDS